VIPYVCKFSPHDFLFLAAAGESGHIALLRADVALRRADQIFLLESLQVSASIIYDLTFLQSRANLLCAGSGDQSVYFVDTAQLEVISSHLKHVRTVTCVRDVATGVLSGGRDGRICLWDHRAATPSFTVDLKTGTHIASIVSPSDDLFISADGHGELRVWDLRTQTTVCRVPMPKAGTPISHCAVSRDRTLLASVLTDNTIVVHKLDGRWRYSVRNWQAVGSFFTRCCFSPCGKFLVTGSATGALCIFCVANTGDPVLELMHSAAATCVDWCAESFEHIVSCSDDRSIQLWGAEYGRAGPRREAAEGIEMGETQDRGDVPPRTFTLHHFVRQ
jgi:WD40 repeat protein